MNWSFAGRTPQAGTPEAVVQTSAEADGDTVQTCLLYTSIAEVNCQFCGKQYKVDLNDLLKNWPDTVEKQ